MVSFKGSITTITLFEVLLSSSLAQNSSKEASIMFSLLATPANLTNSCKASGGYPLLLSPEIVGILGSSQPLTAPDLTNDISFLFEVIVWLRFSLANSLCLGLIFSGCAICFKNQL